MDRIYDFLFYGIIIVGAALFFGLAYYRIDWARHPEKYKKEAEEYDKAKAAKQKAAVERVKAKEAGKPVPKKKYKKPETFLELLDYKLKTRHDKK